MRYNILLLLLFFTLSYMDGAAKIQEKEKQRS